MMKAAPASSFIVAQSEFLLQFFVVALNDPAMLRQAHQLAQLGRRRQSAKPIPGRFCLLAWPLDQQPFLSPGFRPLVVAMRRTYSHGSKTRTQGLASSLSPTHHLPSRRRQTHGQFAHGNRVMLLVPPHPFGGATVSLPWSLGQRGLAGWPDTHRRLNTQDIRQA